MTQLVALTVDNETEILVEPAGTRSGPVNVARPGVRQARRHLEQVFGQVRQIAETVADKIRDLPQRPDEVTVELGVGLTTTADVFIAQSTANAAFKVTLTWKAASREE
ncbi:hypothetical protein NI17_022700 [Thermobifida halotolerans]|uniref:Uncharacterized protein n=1 Tax=Thermobifida halotolerans TaxID=483545 RepID=A0A399G5K3_9ACTN|nr:CU044_2847 family protein [Thermobifida halotolerans]UOE19491.1 hypothetical protein NI17_022700 [Thermobifida halotolerans]